jgi:hypothetical protein
MYKYCNWFSQSNLRHVCSIESTPSRTNPPPPNEIRRLQRVIRHSNKYAPFSGAMLSMRTKNSLSTFSFPSLRAQQSFLSKKRQYFRQYFRQFFRRKYFKVITSTPPSCFCSSILFSRWLGEYSETCSNLLSCKFSVTSCARLPNYIKLGLLYIFILFKTTFISI